MDNYIVGIHKAIEVARHLRNGGAKIKRVKKGEWQVTYSPAFMSRPKKGDKILISQRHSGNDVYIIPEPEWMLRYEPPPIDSRWRYIQLHDWGWSDDDNNRWINPSIT